MESNHLERRGCLILESALERIKNLDFENVNNRVSDRTLVASMLG